MTWPENLSAATGAWREFCRALETTGVDALSKTMTKDEIDLAEGLRYLTRIAGLAAFSSMENLDSAHPYLWAVLDPHRKMGGDNPQGLYLQAPINGTDTYRLGGDRGSARWVSIIVAQDGLDRFGEALFLPDFEFDDDGNFEVTISPTPSPGNWLRSSEITSGVLIRQFFGSADDVTPMTLTIENLTDRSGSPTPLSLPPTVDRLARASLIFSALVPIMQQEMLDKADNLNGFKTDIGDPTSTSGGVPGGNAVTARWALEASEALVIRVTPPSPCAYWDVQVGNGWYESFDYRHYFSGLTCDNAHVGDTGELVLIISERDPGTVNWLQTAGHRQGHVAIRWQLSDGNLPLPDTAVMAVEEVVSATGLPTVTPAERTTARRQLIDSFTNRFGF